MRRKKVTTDAGGERGKPKSFEDALARLEQIVERLESGEESLEDSLRLYEEATALGRYCQQRLQAAEQRIAKLANEDQEEA
ncbi:MAG TPA: exodeoxyribonuclease VII small subunit [Armatimonadota bacterium]|nr:exodeoxyribonuclease VII small subunit [Armatimonadota bacterium]